MTNVGCSPADVDLDATLNDLGLSSNGAIVLSGELSELLDRPVSPIDFWEHPTITALAAYLAGAEFNDATEPVRAHVRRTMDEPIAVVGLGCRLPGGVHDPETLWHFLSQGRTAVAEVPSDRWSPFDDGSPETADILGRTTRWGSFLDAVDAFDAEFFDISAREAVKMDPQQRLLLEVAWEAFEHAGIIPDSLRRSHTGVFVGACVSEYGFFASRDLSGVDAWSNTGGALSIIANRLSYFFDLRGPSVTVDTACSSSLVALHLACQSLRVQDCDLAVAAGVNLLLSPAVFRGFDQSGALSRTGACHAFDADADGFVRGEGCGAVVLKRLSDAECDGDRVLALVRGSAINQDGRSNGLFAPNPAAQMAVLRAAYTNAGVPTQDVDFVETHGTGTMLGDPIEARALGTVLGRGRARQAPLLLGAVKSNLGHLEAAAGITGFIKTVLAVRRAEIPRNPLFRTPNPHIPFDDLRLEVVADNRKWPSTSHPRRAGVSSFGFGGTNAHVVIEQAPEAETVPASPEPAVTTLVVSAKSPERVAATAAVMARWMADAGAHVRLADMAHTLNHHRSTHDYFATVCARDRHRAVAGLEALAAGVSADGLVGPHEGPCAPGTVFLYSGQGSQWAGMGRRLLAEEPAFAAAIDDLEPLFVDHVGFSLRRVIADGLAVTGDAQVQPALMGLQLALTELWRSYGVHPDAVIGHSMGEVSAAVVAGALSVADGLRVISVRSRLMSRLSGQGAVALLKLSADATEHLLAGYPGVTVAGYLSPRQTVVAGPVAPVEALIATVSAQNRFARRVNMDVASHTEMMDPILPELRSALADLAPVTADIPFYSTVTANDGRPDEPRLDAEYWADNVRQPARVSQAITAAASDHATFVEISAHPLLTMAVDDTLDTDTHHHVIATLTRDGDDTVAFHTNVNATHTVRPPQTPHPLEPHPELPASPWQHTSHWITPGRPAATVRRAVPRADPPLIPPEWWCELTWLEREPATAEPQTDQAWLVVSDADVGAELGLMLDGSVTTLSDDSPDADLVAALAEASHVLYAPRASADQVDDIDAAYSFFHAARRLTAMAASMALPPRLYFLTRNAQPSGDSDRANPAHAVLWGLGRTLALEHPEVWGGIVDADESVPDAVAARYVLQEVNATDEEDQVVYRAGVRRVPRLQRGEPPPVAPVEFTDGGCHLVIGATGNIGPTLIRQLADMGATTVVAVSRSPGTRLDDLAKSLAEVGSTLHTVAADVSDKQAMSRLFDRFGADLPPLRGVYLAAFGGGPKTMADMSDDDVTAMFRPKIDAAVLLHALSLRHPVTQFVLFSSISGLTGSRWLAHYTATTAFLDTFAHARRTAGLPATAINWGLWKSLSEGQSDSERRITLDAGLEPMPDEVAIGALRTAIDPSAAVRSIVAAADWARLSAAYRSRARLRIVEMLVPTDVDEGVRSVPDSPVRTQLRAAEPTRRRDILVDHVRAQVASAMGLASHHLLEPSAGFFQSGMDSLMSVTLQRALSESLGEALPTSVIFDYPTVDALTGYLCTVLPELIEVFDSGVDEYDELSDDELLRQLSDRLGSS